jgi:hypothetical protein
VTTLPPSSDKNPARLDAIHRASPYLQTPEPTQGRIHKHNLNQLRELRQVFKGIHESLHLMAMHNAQMFYNCITFRKLVIYFRLLTRFPAGLEPLLSYPCVQPALEGLLTGIQAAEA